MLLGVVTIAACVAGLMQLRQISAAQKALNDRALPALIQTQTVERSLNDMFLALERATYAENEVDLRTTQMELADRITLFRTAIHEAARIQGRANPSAALMAEFTELEITITQLVAGQRQLFETETRLARLRDELEDIGARASEALTKLRYDTTVQIESILTSARSGVISQTDTIDQLFSDLFLASLNLASLKTDLDAVIDLSLSATDSDSAELDRGLNAHLEMSLNRMAAVLSQLSASPQRRSLASLTLRLNDLILADEGLLAIAEAKSTYRDELLDLRVARADITREVKQFIDIMAADANLLVADRSKRLSDATRLLSIVLMVCVFLAAMATLLGNSIVIEKQINRRMEKLREAVCAIADGDLDHPIDIAGNDELADIAQALHIFKQNAEELRRSNVDLERFAYVAAHDLRSPLRAVQDLVDWTLDDEQTALSEESRSYMDMAQSRARRLDRLLTDLLDYARTGQERHVMTEVDVEDLVTQVSAMISPPKSFQISFEGDLPVLRTFKTPLTQILINLISNAIKHHDRADGKVVVSARQDLNRLVLEVSDDGPGIPVKYQNRIFELFQTLRPRDEVEGSGIGLAIIEKILERYGSHLAVVSDPETKRGAAFRFDFPIDHIVETSVRPSATAA
ncbi:sensor histidine kinase [Roseobacter cerasinus]|nr:ATP-binding protein [Roseobacter cerasinus]